MMHALLTFLKSNKHLDTLIRRNPYYYKQAVETFNKVDQLSFEERIKWQYEAVERTLRTARKTKYGSLYPEVLHEWPVLNKETVRDHTTNFVVPSSAKLRIQASTGGTSGVPLRLYRSLRSVTYEQAAIDEITSKHGFTLDQARVAVLRADSIKSVTDQKPPFWTYTHKGKRLVLSSHHLNKHTAGAYWKELQRFRPEVLWAYPSSLELLLSSIGESVKSIPIPYVFTSSEMLSRDTRLHTQSLLQSKLIDLYGQAERVAMAYGMGEAGYRFVPGYAIVELQFHSSEDQYDVYEIIGTGLWNEVMPLVRYRTGDLIRVTRGTTERQLKEIELGLRSFPSIVGRSSDYLLTRDRGRLIGINHLPRGVQHLVQMQVIQFDWDKVEIHILADAAFSSEDEQQLLRNAREKIPPSIDIRIIKKEQLIRSSSGKLPYVIRHVTEPSSPSAQPRP